MSVIHPINPRCPAALIQALVIGFLAACFLKQLLALTSERSLIQSDSGAGLATVSGDLFIVCSSRNIGS